MEEKNNSHNKTIQIHYEKNPLYRSIYSDGAYGGVSPLNQINLSFYATRRPIPKSINFEVDENGMMGKQINVSGDSKTGVMREVEVTVYMNRTTGRELYDFLKRIFEEEKK